VTVLQASVLIFRPLLQHFILTTNIGHPRYLLGSNKTPTFHAYGNLDLATDAEATKCSSQVDRAENLLTSIVG